MKNFDAIRPNHNHTPNPPVLRRRHKRLGFLVLILVLAVIGSAVFGAVKLISKTNKIFTNQKSNIVERVGRLFIGSDRELIGETEGQINVLLLGMGGPGHDGPFLTDTIIVAQINPQTKNVVLVSIPRDFVIQLNGLGFRKVNAAYAFAETADEGTGGLAAIDAAERITGLAIPYYAAVDFSGFVKAVDHLGGIDVEIDRTFTDASYPDSNRGFLAPITFTKGWEHMNGERALQFARSRKGNNGEGSDFARSERQKKIILAVKERVIKLNLTDLRTANNLLSDFTESFRTNLELHELVRLADLTKDIPADNVSSLSLEPDGNLICQGLIEDYENRVYVIQPCQGKTLKDIHTLLAETPALPALTKEQAVIEIQNSTGNNTALQAIAGLQNLRLDLKILSYKSRTPYERTIIYDNSLGKKPETRQFLQENFNFTFADLPYTNSTADFVIILGKDAL